MDELLRRQSGAKLRVCLVPVVAKELHRMTVEQDLTALCCNCANTKTLNYGVASDHHLHLVQMR